MKNVKDVLDTYEETPSADVWKRLNVRLDEEIPVAGDVSRLQRVKAWRWAAAILAVLMVGGALTVGFFLHNRENQDITAENISKVVDDKDVTESDAVTKLDGTAEMEEVTPSVKSVQEPQSHAVTDMAEEESIAQPKAQKSADFPKANSPQIVLPPNSTLAKQLAADPVLKNLSDDSVDWSLPVHLSIPNLFTPNNDGVNDLFVIEGLDNYSMPRLVVRDKNNRVVYRSDAYNNTWDGGSCPEGVYSYEFTFVYNGIENQATGKVRIIRA